MNDGAVVLMLAACSLLGVTFFLTGSGPSERRGYIMSGFLFVLATLWQWMGRQ